MLGSPPKKCHSQTTSARQFNALRRMARQNDAIQKAARSVRPAAREQQHRRDFGSQDSDRYPSWSMKDMQVILRLTVGGPKGRDVVSP